ncbi:hypothetical protein RO3G_15684 [Rhizopus delemar RA 99-880]|uniref:Uncharacterized protein n=1 Tax=Rhizopus delemar (strain RA 99-880 / ATCC MYA-4621 / FGSC 9543 / NRRL 43880) TaxID=246409 RepID=I1CR93_RHIO9|nr:hypothetical protein RO3G_15684 [Rhizopus delemar RA 99-880]|eukprot:EIE90973.1 hypothetical protein RO3G_15684 [Rhizopus delemar RA 99-880]
MTTVHELSNGVLTKINTVKKIMDFITENMDSIIVKLLLCFKALVEALPSNTQQKKVKDDNRNDDHPTVTKDTPDGCVENDRETIGFIEVTTIDNAANPRK